MMKRSIFWLVAATALAQDAVAPKPTFEQAVSAYYRAVAVLNGHEAEAAQIRLRLAQLQTLIPEEAKAARVAESVLKSACDGVVDGLEKFEPACKSVPGSK